LLSGIPLSAALSPASSRQLSGNSLYWLLQSIRYVSEVDWWKKNGFETQIRHTYRLPVTEHPHILFRQFRPSTRSRIKKAAAYLQVRPVDHLQEFMAVYVQHARAKKIFLPAHAQAFQSIFSACLQREQGELLCAYDEQGRLHAGAFFVWDQTTTYLLIVSRNQDFQHSFAARLLLWHGIQRAITRGHVFDFNGGDVPSIGDFFASFGATKTPYLRATRYSNVFGRTFVRCVKFLRNPRNALFH